MKKILIPAVLTATIMIAGMFAIVDVDRVMAGHLPNIGTITSASIGTGVITSDDIGKVIVDADVVNNALTGAVLNDDITFDTITHESGGADPLIIKTTENDDAADVVLQTDGAAADIVLDANSGDGDEVIITDTSFTVANLNTISLTSTTTTAIDATTTNTITAEDALIIRGDGTVGANVLTLEVDGTAAVVNQILIQNDGDEANDNIILDADADGGGVVEFTLDIDQTTFLNTINLGARGAGLTVDGSLEITITKSFEAADCTGGKTIDTINTANGGDFLILVSETGICTYTETASNLEIGAATVAVADGGVAMFVFDDVQSKWLLIATIDN